MTITSEAIEKLKEVKRRKEEFDKTKRVIDNEFLNSLPEYLKHDIKMVEENDRSCGSYDCYLDELYSSINGCQWDGVISLLEADELREKFLYKNIIIDK